MSSVKDAPPDETPKTDVPPPSSYEPMGSAAHIARLYEELRQRSHLATVVAALNLSQASAAWLFTPSPLPENHPFYALIGRVASEWAHLEHIVDLTIWQLLGVDHRLAACLTAQYPGIPARCNAVCSLGVAKGLTKEQVRPFAQLKGLSFEIADWRARWLHDPWFVQEGSQPAQFRAMPAADPRFGLQAIAEDEIQRTIEEIKALQQRAQEAQKHVLDALAALPERPG